MLRETTKHCTAKNAKNAKLSGNIFANSARFAVRFAPSSLWILTLCDHLGVGDQYADPGEDKEEADERDVRGRSKDAPALWAAQRKYEEKHERAEVRADEEMDVGV